MNTIKMLGTAFVAAVLSVGCAASSTDDASTPEAESSSEALSSGVVGYTHDQCGALLRVRDASGGLHTIQRGVPQTIWIGSPRFDWYCGYSLEHSTCPAGTQYVRVYHHTDSRQIDWTCRWEP